MQDVLCLQALSKRIHYGKFVAEAKFRADPEQYRELISNRDQDAIMQTLTSIDVEKKVWTVPVITLRIGAEPAWMFFARTDC